MSRNVPTSGSPPYLFLDVDGVLNNSASVAACGGSGSSKRPWRLDPVSIGLVEKLVELREAHVVVSSSWRGGGPEKFASMMALYGWYNCPVVGETKFRNDASVFDEENYESRGDLIRLWLENHAPEALRGRQYLIVDDERWAGHEHPEDCFVQTTFEAGFRYSDYRKALSLL